MNKQQKVCSTSSTAPELHMKGPYNTIRALWVAKHADISCQLTKDIPTTPVRDDVRYIDGTHKWIYTSVPSFFDVNCFEHITTSQES